jgi:hypothetical protein
MPISIQNSQHFGSRFLTIRGAADTLDVQAFTDHILIKSLIIRPNHKKSGWPDSNYTEKLISNALKFVKTKVRLSIRAKDTFEQK